MVEIAFLTPQVIDQIAAGEVVERPASVVKELAENAFDAEASHIQVTLEEGGLKRIEIRDNGFGMSPAQLQLAVMRHTTSKLTHMNDLHSLGTFGFRGEALAAMAAVSHLTIESRQTNQDCGVRMRFAYNKIIDQETIGMPIGTRVVVDNLFFNTPARRKFMKSAATELAHSIGNVARTTLAYPRLGCEVFAHGRKLLDIAAHGHPQERIAAALKLRRDDTLRFIEHTDQAHGLEVTGYCGIKTVASSQQWFYVNHRFVRDRLLMRALSDVAQHLLGSGAQIFGVLYLKVLPSQVDINVHPQKLEVRFVQTTPIYQLITSALLLALGDVKPAAPSSSDHSPPRFEHSPAPAPPPSSQATHLPLPLPSHAPSPSPLSAMAAAQPASMASSWISFAFKEGLYVVMAQDNLLVVHKNSFLKDHCWQQYLQQIKQHMVISQRLILPLALPAEATPLPDDTVKTWQSLGFGFNALEPPTWLLTSIPAALELAGAENLLALLLTSWHPSTEQALTNLSEGLQHIDWQWPQPQDVHAMDWLDALQSDHCRGVLKLQPEQLRDMLAHQNSNL